MLITNITSKPWLSKESIRWYGLNRNLPTSAEVLSSTVHGTTYSTLKLYNLSYFEDSGEYINSASNKCGESTVSVFIAVRRSELPHSLCPLADYIMTFQSHHIALIIKCLLWYHRQRIIPLLQENMLHLVACLMALRTFIILSVLFQATGLSNM